MEPGMQAGDDPSLDSAVSAITAKLRAGAGEERPDRRENREDRDDLERQGSNDLDETDAQERQAQSKQEGDAQESEGAEASAEEAEGEEDQFIELPAAEEGGEAQRVPLSEAVEAVQKLRQMNGEIATAVIRAEEEAFTKQDQIVQALDKTFSTVREQARVALEMMNFYAPPAPEPILVDRNSGYYDPEYYHNAKIQYDNFVAKYTEVRNTLRQVDEGRKATGAYQDTTLVQRETERTARFIPEFKEPQTREARKAEILDTLSKRYGVTKDELDDIVDHKAWRMMNDLTNMVTAEKKAPEVRKHLQEKKAKIVNGRVSQVRDPQSGKFVSDARKELKSTGSEDAFARLLLRSGALKR